jgi:UDP-xylose/UDP-N-acetylglucosamine transporter B4
MLFGWLVRRKTYTVGQVVSVLLVTVGVVLSALSRPSSSTSAPTDTKQYLVGIVMLVVSLLLSGWLGMLQEQTYEKYGPQWKEGIFYTVAFFALPQAALRSKLLNSTHYLCQSSCFLFKISKTASEASQLLTAATRQRSHIYHTRSLRPTWSLKPSACPV